MMARTGNYLIPFDSDGNQQHYPERSYEPVPGTDRTRIVDPDWRPNFEFEDTLTYEGFSRGRSAAYVLFRRGDGKRVTMFLKELDELMPRMCGGHVTGRFTFIKRGQNYGVRILPLA
jgi:hypothetical protein